MFVTKFSRKSLFLMNPSPNVFSLSALKRYLRFSG